MRRALLYMAAQSALLAVGACATARTPEGEKELTRNAIHARHTWCMEQGDRYAYNHGYDAMRYFWCDQQSNKECLAAGLEARCDQWQMGGL